LAHSCALDVNYLKSLRWISILVYKSTRNTIETTVQLLKVIFVKGSYKIW